MPDDDVDVDGDDEEADAEEDDDEEEGGAAVDPLVDACRPAAPQSSMRAVRSANSCRCKATIAGMCANTVSTSVSLSGGGRCGANESRTDVGDDDCADLASAEDGLLFECVPPPPLLLLPSGVEM